MMAGPPGVTRYYLCSWMGGFILPPFQVYPAFTLDIDTGTAQDARGTIPLGTPSGHLPVWAT